MAAIPCGPVTVDRSGARYEEVERAIRDLIAAAGPGGPLPPELELAGRLGVSRGTVRKAMDRFVAAGTIVRSRSRGTFVKHQSIERGVVVGAIGASRGHHFEVVSTHVRTRRARTAEAAALYLDRGDQVQEVTRKAHLEGKPVSLNVSVFPEDVPLPDDLTRPWAASLASMGVHLATLEDAVTAEAASKRVARELEVAPGEPILLITRRSFDDSGRPVEYAKAWLHPDASYANQHHL